ncbi:lipase family protein [Streptomyces sp. cg35]|uniref:lipase family protein n=1 Tax=Streptomyces sp. cg35 TaxID=3421650 RepID=UPI003D1790F1
MVDSESAGRKSGQGSSTSLQPDVPPPVPVGPDGLTSLVLRTSARNASITTRGGSGGGVSYTGYDRGMALLLSAASAWAYSETEQTLCQMLKTSFGISDAECTAFDVKNGALLVDTQAFLVQGTLPDREGGSAGRPLSILIFRGTEFGGVSLTDIYTDIVTETVPYPDTVGSMVHAGFLRGFKYAWPEIVGHLGGRGKSKNEIGELYITGHSLGGALAVFAACELFDNGLKQLTKDLREELQHAFRGLYTFGQPMVGDQAFADHFQEIFGAMTFRHVYQYDLVPRFPPRTAGSFRHFGREMFGTRNSAWEERKFTARQVLAATVAFPIGILAFVLRQLPAGRKLSLPVSLDDHIPQNYVDCSKLENAATTFP